MKDWRIKLDCACVVALAVTATIALCSCKPSKAAEVVCEPTTLATTEETAEVITEPTETKPPVTETTEPTETIEETKPLYTQEELEYMAIVIYQEAGGDECSDETRLMVGTVVMNRVADPRFPNTIYEVLTQKSQYGRLYWTGLVWADRASNPGEAHAVERAYRCAEKILAGYRAFDSDVIWQAEFVQGTEIVAYQDGIYFCR